MKWLPLALLLPLALVACDRNEESQATAETTGPEMQETMPAPEPAVAEVATDGVIDVVTRDYTIEGPDTMKLGWNTFRFSNEGNQTHFVAMYRLVEGKTIEDQLAEVAPVFDPLMEGLRSGELTKEDIGPFFAENVPEWGLQMTWVGGAGLLAPGGTTQSTFHVDQPGTYLLECYVKAPDGSWHTLMGMLKQVDVGSEQTGMQEPQADVEIVVSNAGVQAPDTLPAGKHTFKVQMAEHPEGSFMPFDLNLARIDAGASLEDVIFWMDWTNVGGLRAPAPVEFLGGVEHMNAPKHGYMTVDLEPGTYLWVSEVNAGNIHMTFTVE